MKTIIAPHTGAERINRMETSVRDLGLVRDQIRERKVNPPAFTTFQKEAEESCVQIAHFARAVRLFRAFRSFRRTGVAAACRRLR